MAEKFHRLLAGRQAEIAADIQDRVDRLLGGDRGQIVQGRTQFAEILFLFIRLQPTEQKLDHYRRHQIAASLHHPATTFRSESRPDFFQERKQAHIA